jgi:hypothetical protein
MITFKKYLSEAIEFNEEQAVKDALKWMKNKYDDLYDFMHIPGMDMNGENTKTYDIVVDGRTYILKLKKFDSNGDGKKNALGFDVKPAVEPDEEEDEL